MLIPKAIIAHVSKGRLRLRIGKKRGDIEYFKHLNNFFSKLQSVQQVQINPNSGSLLLITTLLIETILKIAQEINLFIIEPENTSKPSMSKKIKKQNFSEYTDRTHYTDSPSGLKRLAKNVYNLDLAIKKSTYGVLDLTTIAFGAFAGMGIYQIARGQVLASGTSLLATAVALIPLQRVIHEQEKAHY